MPDVADQPTKPVSTWRPMIFWTAGILLALGLVWFVAAVVVPFLQTRSVLKDSSLARRNPMPDPDRDEGFIAQLGGPERAIRRLRTYLRFPVGVTPERTEATRLLGRCGEPAADALRAVLKHPDPEVRRRAADGLSRFHRSADVPAFVEAVGDANAKVRRRAVFALGVIGAPAAVAVPAIVQALADVDQDVRTEAARSLGRIGPSAREAVPALEKALSDTDGRVRREAALAHCLLSGQGDKGIPVLIRGLTAADGVERANAAVTIGDLGTLAADAVPALITAVQDEEYSVRDAAIRTLGKIGPAARAAVPALEERQADKYDFIRRSAREALKKIRAEESPK